MLERLLKQLNKYLVKHWRIKKSDQGRHTFQLAVISSGEKLKRPLKKQQLGCDLHQCNNSKIWLGRVSFYHLLCLSV